VRIRATILTPVLAVFTVVALIGTGIAINQTHHEDVSATALDSVPVLATATSTTLAVADTGLAESPEPVSPVAVRATSAPSGQVVTEQEEPEEEPEDDSYAEAEEDD
jgi:hypothetical protein